MRTAARTRSSIALLMAIQTGTADVVAAVTVARAVAVAPSTILLLTSLSKQIVSNYTSIYQMTCNIKIRSASR